MLQPNKNTKKVAGTGKKIVESSIISQVLSKIPFADEIYDVANIYGGLKEGDYKKIGSNFIGALLPGVSGKAFEAVAEDWLPPTPEIEKKKTQFNLQSSPAERQEFLKKYGAGYLNNPEFIKDQKLAYGTGNKGIMKRKMNPRKKYANGTNNKGVGPNNYIQDPSTTLADYNIMLAEADSEAMANPWLPIVGSLGAIAQSVVGSGALTGLANGQPATTTPAVSANGNSGINKDTEVEGGEAFQTPNGQVGEFQGPSHEQGGIPLNAGEDIPEGTIVYSDRLKVAGKTMAERKAIRERQTANIEKSVAKGADLAMKNAAQRKMMAIQREEQSDLQHQEMINNMQQMADTMVKAFGTGVAGLQGETVQENGVGDSMKYDNGGIVGPKNLLFPKPDLPGNEIPTLLNNFNAVDMPEHIENPFYKDSALPMIDLVEVDKISTANTPQKKELNLPTPAIGDLTQFIGDYLGGTAGLKNAAESRSTDVAHENVYANAGKEAQKYLGEAKAGINAQKEQAILRTTSQGATGKKGARGTSRGVNQMRATDWLYDTALQSSIAEISAKAAEQLTALSSSQAQMSMNADQLKGQGEYQANMANEAAKDAYYTAKGLGLKDQASAVQVAGKNMNDMKQNEIIANLMNNYGKWVTADQKGKLSNITK